MYFTDLGRLEYNNHEKGDYCNDQWLWLQLMNPTFLFLALATCTEGMIVSGIAAFGAKFFQEKFNLPAAFAGLLMGWFE